ncbi:hypothetical protein [Absidia glauca]|uniref:Major facilitator superfamily (MFS) profile domain-containing protein n=1 Tax=Absidia glauca TaxID=4829 RepID=A0A168QQI9_ABSGL|nr:hypothetical protein [Absidia glauca]
MYNALTGMGGAGQADTTAADNSATALAVTFTLCSLIGAPLFNIFGHRVLIPAAGLTYVLYVGAFLSPSSAFTIVAGAILGVGAGCLWTAQGAIMVSYPNESEKGKAFAIFWGVFNLGGTVGACVALGNEWSAGEASHVQQSTYYAFIVIMTVGACIGALLLPANKVIRNDGSQVSLHKYSNWKREAIEVLKLFADWRMLVMIPLMISSNWFYTYQQQAYNGGGYFNIRARALNNLVYWAMQILGAGAFGWMLDLKALGNRKRRAYIGNTVVIVVLGALWIGAIFIQQRFTRDSVNVTLHPDFVKMDVWTPGFGPLCLEYALFGMADSIYQGFVYWLLGTMTNDTERSARYVGFYKTIQNTGNAIASQIDAKRTEFMTELIIVFVLNMVGLFLAYVVCYTVPDVTVEEIDNLADGGKEIIVGGHVETIEDGQKKELGEKSEVDL